MKKSAVGHAAGEDVTGKASQGAHVFLDYTNAVFVDEAHLEALDQVDCISEAPAADFSAFCAATEGVSHFLMLERMLLF